MTALLFDPDLPGGAERDHRRAAVPQGEAEAGPRAPEQHFGIPIPASSPKRPRVHRSVRCPIAPRLRSRPTSPARAARCPNGGKPGAQGADRWCAAPDRSPQAPSGASDARPGGARCARPRGADEAPCGGRRRTGTSGTARQSAASARASRRSPPSARSRARSARSPAGGIVGSGSAPGGRAPPSRGARSGSSTGPAR